MKYIVGDWNTRFQIIKFDLSCWYTQKTKKAFYVSFGKYLVVFNK